MKDARVSDRWLADLDRGKFDDLIVDFGVRRVEAVRGISVEAVIVKKQQPACSSTAGDPE